jgi:hypothetical protein
MGRGKWEGEGWDVGGYPGPSMGGAAADCAGVWAVLAVWTRAAVLAVWTRAVLAVWTRAVLAVWTRAVLAVWTRAVLAVWTRAARAGPGVRPEQRDGQLPRTSSAQWCDRSGRR